MSALEPLDDGARSVLDSLCAQVAERPSRVAVLFPAVGRRVARGPGPSGDPTGTLGPTLEDLARIELLRTVVGSLSPTDAATEITDLYGYGDADEKRAVLHGLHLLDGTVPEVSGAVRDLLADALRTNDTRLIAAAAASPTQSLSDDHAWRQTVLKCLFVGVPLRLMAGLDTRGDLELARMCADFAHERTAAGRAVPTDVRSVLDRFPEHPFHERPQEG